MSDMSNEASLYFTIEHSIEQSHTYTIRNIRVCEYILLQSEDSIE